MTADPLRDFDWTTPFIADACALLQLPIRLGPAHIRPAGARRPKISGPARPAKHAGSTDVFLEAIAASRPGEVLVIDNVGRLDEGCIGDLVAGEAHVAGMAGIVLYGAHRDTAAIEAIGIPVWSLGGHVTVTRDDYVFADIDGVVVVKQSELQRIASAARDIAVREQAQAARLLQGERLRDQLRLDAYLTRRQSEPSYTFRDHIKSLGGAIEI